MATTRTTKRPTDVFKPAVKGDSIRCAYLYADGHATVSFERYLRDVDQTITYYRQIDNLGVKCSFTGRIVFSQFGGVAWLRAMLAAGATYIRAREAATDAGSENTKRAGIAVGFVEVHTPLGTIHAYQLPGLMSGDQTYQPDVGEIFDPSLETYTPGCAVVETLLSAQQ